MDITASAGLGLLQFCNLNSFRTKFILGFSFFMGLSVPQYFNGYVLTTGQGPVNTGSLWVRIKQLISSHPSLLKEADALINSCAMCSLTN